MKKDDFKGSNNCLSEGTIYVIAGKDKADIAKCNSFSDKKYPD
jgi:hypothetical protein